MNEKAKVTIVAQDGEKRELKGDTVIVFSIEKEDEVMKGKVTQLDTRVGIVGKSIPDPIFDFTFGNLVINAIEGHYKDKPLLAAFNMSEISKMLKKRSDEIMENTSKEELNAALGSVFKEILKSLG